MRRCRGGKLIITNAEDVFRYRSRGPYNHQFRPPGYAGLLVASKQTSLELQSILYSERVFGAHLCKFSDNNLPIPSPPALDRLQKLEIFLDQTGDPRKEHLSAGDDFEVEIAIDGAELGPSIG